MYRYVATETGEMMKCAQGAWVKHDDCVILEKRIMRLEEEMERLQKENELWIKDNIVLTRRNLRLEEELKREKELNGEKSVLIEDLRHALIYRDM